MKTKIFAILLCAVLLFALAACGDDKNEKDTGTGDGTSAATGTGEATGTEKATDTTSGGGIILPEDGKITFGTGDKTTTDTAGTEKAGNDTTGRVSDSSSAPDDTSDGTAKVSVDTSVSTETAKSTETSGSAETAKPADESSGTSSDTTGSGNYGGLDWNN